MKGITKASKWPYNVVFVIKDDAFDVMTPYSSEIQRSVSYFHIVQFYDEGEIVVFQLRNEILAFYCCESSEIVDHINQKIKKLKEIFQESQSK